MKSTLLLPLAAALAAQFPATAMSQSLPDIQDAIGRAGQIDEAIRTQDELRPQVDAADTAIDGEAGVYVMQLNKIFYVGASLGGGWSENPLQTSDDAGGSAFVTAAASTGVQTRLGQALDFGLAVSVSGTQYDKDFAPSSRTISGALNLGTEIAGTPLYVGVNGFAGRNFDDDFKNGSGFYGGSAFVAAALPLGKRTVLRPNVSVGRQWSGIEENNSWHVTASFDLRHAASERVTLGLSGRVTRTWFDDFFEDVTFVERKDWTYGGNANVTYRATSWLTLSAAGGYAKRDSKFFLSSYEGFEAQATISATARF